MGCICHSSIFCLVRRFLTYIYKLFTLLLPTLQCPSHFRCCFAVQVVPSDDAEAEEGSDPEEDPSVSDAALTDNDGCEGDSMPVMDGESNEIPASQPEMDAVVLCDSEDDHEDERAGVTVQGEEEQEEFSPGDKALPYEPDKTPEKKAPTKVAQTKSSGSSSQTKAKVHIFDDHDDTRDPTPQPDFDKETFVDDRSGSKGSIKELKAKLSTLRKQKSALKLGFNNCFPWFSNFHPLPRFL